MKTIITIGRQFGSGGKEVGIRVAKELGIPFYDKELLQEAAKKSGLCQKIFENFDERPKSLLYAIAMDAYPLGFSGITGESLEQQVHLAIFKTIRHIAEEGPCVVIGRSAIRPGWITKPVEPVHQRPAGGPDRPRGQAPEGDAGGGQEPDPENRQAPGILLRILRL